MNKLYEILNEKGVIELSKYIKNKYNCDLLDELQYTINTMGMNATIELIYNRLNISNDVSNWLQNNDIAYIEVDKLYKRFTKEVTQKISKEKFKYIVCDRLDMKVSQLGDKRVRTFVPKWINTKSKKRLVHSLKSL